MCGICGILNFDKSNKADPELIRKMCRALMHRGPDGEGLYFDENLGLGHRRLSIIDLAGGNQPMSNEDGAIWIVQNGEIYNYIELTDLLKAKGHRFKTQSDTEVILHLYEEFREDCVKHLNGMFAFVIWDSKNKVLFAARDRVGIKPFYYYLAKDRFVFSSEIKAIVEDPTIERLSNYKAISQYLRCMYGLGEETFFKGIKKLLPGNFIQIENGILKVVRYWQPPAERSHNLDEAETVNELRRLLDDAVRCHLRSDVPVGAHLSGGLDSGAIVALAQPYVGDRLKTFSVTFKDAPEHDETPYIQIMNQRFNTDHSEFAPTAADCLEAIPKIVKIMDEPQAGSGIIGQYFLCRLVSQNLKVVLGGQGGDELFGGYYRYLPVLFKETLKKSGWTALKQVPGLFAYVAKIGLLNILQKAQRRSGILGLTTIDYKDTYGQNIPVGIGPLWDLNYFLPALLQVEDRTSMAFSVESRVPLLDYRLVEFAFELPLQLKMKDAQLKYLLRSAVENLLPKPIILRKEKQGFSAPINRWFRNEMRSFVEDTLRSRKIQDRGIFELSQVEGMLKAHMAGTKDLSEQLWMLLSVELWFREFMDK